MDVIEFEELGRVVAKCKLSRSAKVRARRFRSHCGSPSDVVASCWELLIESKFVKENKILGRVETNPTHFLWALLFHKTCATMQWMASKLGVDEKTAEKWIKLHLEAIAELDSQVVRLSILHAYIRLFAWFCSRCARAAREFLMQIVWSNRFDGDAQDLCLVTVDGTHFLIRNRRDPWTRKIVKRWCSHKFNHAGVSYEIAACIKTDNIVWTHGPFPAACHDISTFRCRLRDMLLPMERVLCDRGYRGDAKCLTPHNARDAQHKRAVAACRGRHETANRRFKTFGSLKQMFRHEPDEHHLFFRAAAVMIQLAHQNGCCCYDVVGCVDPACEAEWDEGDEQA